MAFTTLPTFLVAPVLAADLATVTTAIAELRTGSAGLSNAAGAGTTTSSSYADVAGSTSVSFTKLQASTAIVAAVSLNCYITGATNTPVSVALSINATDYEIYEYFLNDISKHYPTNGYRRVTGVAAGTYTVQVRWKRVSGSGTVTTDVNDWVSVSLQEAW